MWQFRGQQRPPFAIDPGPGQESVWDYPRPPAIVADGRRIVVRCADQLVAETTRAVRILGEWKGEASYWSFVHGKFRREEIGWSYPAPTEAFAAIAGYFSFYPSRAECCVNDERVRPQAGGFYGGWVTDEIVGPSKGEPGTGGW
jgi:uncharacterized protein (DUF427 family)